jgi:protein-L-isoaspartate O-methyltransferase
MERRLRDCYIVTQVDDGTPLDLDAVGDLSTSSASQPSYVFRMLAAIAVQPGMRVLEIGTGTGYTAALLSARLGDRNVTTIEVDEDVADDAKRALTRAGFRPTVLLGDGARGYPPNARYDRVIATCLVRAVPYAWVEQTLPGGLILTPWGTAYHPSGLLLPGRRHDHHHTRSLERPWRRARRVRYRTARTRLPVHPRRRRRRVRRVHAVARRRPRLVGQRRLRTRRQHLRRRAVRPAPPVGRSRIGLRVVGRRGSPQA